jgi:hypothetical protein
MDNHAGRITIIASSTMVHQRVRCMICDRPVDHRVVFMTNDARVLHAGCIPDHVKVPTTVLLQAIRRLERMVTRARNEDGVGSEAEDEATEPAPAPPTAPNPAATDPAATDPAAPNPAATDPAAPNPVSRPPNPSAPSPATPGPDGPGPGPAAP